MSIWSDDLQRELVNSKNEESYPNNIWIHLPLNIVIRCLLGNLRRCFNVNLQLYNNQECEGLKNVRKTNSLTLSYRENFEQVLLFFQVYLGNAVAMETGLA